MSLFPLTRKIAAVSASVIAGLLASMSSRLAKADCLPNPPADGQTVTCTGPAPTTVPLDASAASGVTVNVNADAVITGNGNLIVLGAGAQLNNFGSIQPVSTGAGNIGVVALGENSTLRNFGTLVTSGFNSLTFVSVGNNSVLRNEAGGRITVNGDLATGLISSNNEGNQLINAGQITLNTFQGSGMFGQASNRTVLTNTATGVIESNLDEAFGMAAITGLGHVLRNDGTIVTRGQGSHGMLLVDASDSSMTNAGSITTSGGSSETVNRAFGMFVTGGGGNIVGNVVGGVITASGIGSSAMEVAGSTSNLLRNEGTINVSGTGAHGLYVLAGADNTLENRGTVNTSGQRGNGMRADDGDSTFINSGDLLVGGRDAFGVFMQGDNNTLLNSGTIRASGINADGVLSNTLGGSFVARIENTGSIISERSFAVRGVNGQENLINAGVIRSDAGTAIDLRAGNDTLTLRAGSQITGLADGGTGTDGVILEGAGTAANAFANFETLRMTGTDWTWSGSGAFGNTQVESGVLRVSGTLTSPVTVQAGTQLQIGTGATSGTVAGNITDNGAVVFNRSDALSFGGVISGTGSVTKSGAGTLTLTANNTYTGPTILNEGVLAFSNPNNLGTLGNPIVFNGGTLRYLASAFGFIGRPVTLLAGGGTVDTNGFSSEYRGVASGIGGMTKIGAGTLSLTGNNTYTGGTTIGAGTLQVGLGGTTGSLVGNIVNNAALVFNRSDALTYSGVISGSGTLAQSGAGTTTLTGENTYTGATTVSAGTLRVNGSIASPATTVQNAATLGGTGRIAGSVTVRDGGHIAPGASPGTLTISGDLLLSAGSVLDYEAGQANVPGGPFNDLTVVGGNLLLDGTLNVTQTAGGSFGPGVYRVINYGGALSNQGLDLGAMPPGGPFFVQTSVANQVNLVNTQGLVLNFWDGNTSALFNNVAVNGSMGTWLATPANDAWTDSAGAVNAPWQPNGFAIFQGTPGTVTVDNSAGAVTFSGAQFAVDGYTVTGQPLTTNTADTIIRVGDGTAAGAAMSATIAAAIQGSGGLAKTDVGTLVLTGNNTYTGNTTIDGGTLSVRGGTINSPAAHVAVGNSGIGTLRIENGGQVTGTTSVLGANAGSQGAVTVTGSGSVWTTSSGLTIGDSGSGSLTVENGGIVQSGFALGASQGSGTSTIRVSGGGSRWTTSGFVSLLSGTSTMTIDRAGQVRGGSVVIGENAGAQSTALVSGPGSTLTSDSTFEVARSGAGSLTVSGGANVTSAQGFVGRVAGGVGSAVVTGAGSSWVNTGPDLTVGNGGTGTLTISEEATVSAPATYLAFFPGSVGTLNIGGATGNAAAAPGRLDTPTVALGDGTATINFNHTSSGYEFAPRMSGTGTVNALAGTTILSADNTYAGATTIAAPATLQLGNGGTTGSIAGDVANSGTLAFNRSDTVTYSGLISGVGRVVQQGAGTLTLAPSAAGGNTYAGGTFIQQGVLAMPADSVLGAPTGGVTFNGGTLRWLGSFELSATRPISIEAGGATLDTQGFEAIVEQGMTGAGAMTKTGAGTLVLQGANSFSGGTTVNAGTLVVGDSGSRSAALGGGGMVLVNPGATLAGYGSVNGDVVNNGLLKVADAIAGPTSPPLAASVTSKPGVQWLAKPAVLAGGNGSFTVNGTLQNAGVAQLGAVNGVPGNTLTVNSYVGAPGSRVSLNTFLGADNSPSDRLVINGGSASGTSTLQIANAGGGGALTTGDGIVVVAAANGATTANSAFALGGTRLAAGAYEYLLFKGGTANGESWYLRTTLPPMAQPPAPPSAPAPTGTPAPPLPVGEALPPTPGAAPAAAPGVLLPNYRVEVPLDMSVPVLANRLGIAMLGTYHDRAGEDSITATSEGPSRMGAWGRVFGTSGDVRNGSGSTNIGRFDDFTRNGPSYDYKEAGVQAGIDLLRRADANGRGDVAGAYIALGHIDSDVDAIYGGKAGTASMYGYSLGGYWTRKGDSDWYIDGVLQGTRYDSVKTQSIYGEKLAADGWGVAASLEAGYPFVIAPGWALEPQGQLVYQWTRLDDSADRLARIFFDDTSTFYGRIGARLTRRIAQGGEGQDLTAWARVNVWHAFDSEATTTFTNLQGLNPVALSAPLGASTWAQVGVGLSGQIARNMSAFGSVDYNHSLGSGDSHGWSGRAGVRFKW
ncbi:autotransporter outer membrane beta-barrel domain-containing protein [Variovorax sp. J22R24]|uniref:autotransporter outer membrane beta-barrel domain-containing protein n=1 Tax=Variovorax gracilis TaxID=3053502 RepID=UPI002574E189|nr:autotransporter outer membrane beta-barrel domain-containing protein [Variovorax sp. J22R24]MDM0104641.1 autotransporter outer membrane beta-barrel domain-containing protein [Variovorax sp. J22R24]